jgi:predicted transcriptional regulator
VVRPVQTTAGADTDAGDILMAGLFDRLQDEIKARSQQRSLSPIDLLDMPEGLAGVINQIIRKNGMKLEEIAQKLGRTLEETQTNLDELVDRGFIRQVMVREEAWYKANFGRKADKTLSTDIWSALDDVFGQTKKT